MKKSIAASLALFCALALAQPALAARQCYKPAELEAEQLLRFHSELMVVAYACKQGSKAQDLITYYNGFTNHNIVALQKAEQTLIDYFKNRYHDDGISHLDEMHTKMGNEFGNEAAEDSAPLFCRQYRDVVITAYYQTPVQVQNQIRHMALTQKSYDKLCKYKVADNSKTARIDKKTP